MENVEENNHYEKLSGIIEHITFRNEENGWSVIKVSPLDMPNNLETVIIHQIQIIPGDSMDFYGSWIVHPKFGKQFKADVSIQRKPANIRALEKYIGSGLIKGVGSKTAQKIVNYFKEETLNVFDDEIERILEVPTIGKKKLVIIRDSWKEHKVLRDVMIFLQSHGISTVFSVKIYKKYGDDSIAIVSKNPYILARDIYGIGFMSADRIAKSVGFAEDSKERVSAGIKHILSTSRDEGHCYLTKNQLYEKVLNLLGLEMDFSIENPLKELIDLNEIKTRDLETNETFYYSNSLYWDEVNVSRRIKELLKTECHIDKERICTWVKEYCKKIDIELSEEQFETVINISQNSFSIITGGPGCGKTTVTKVIVKLFEAMNKFAEPKIILLAAPTGRASQRMTEVIGKSAKTIHRLLVWNPKTGQFDRNEKNKIEANVLIIDEVSMLDISLASSLLKAVPDNCQVIFIGDPDQLPSVGAGNLLSDLLACDFIPHYRLTKIFRQAQNSLIITHAHEINSGKIPQISTPVSDNSLFKSNIDCLFVDSEEATQEQINFIKKSKYAIKQVEQEGKIKVFERDDIKKVVAKDSSGSLNIYSSKTLSEIDEPYDTFVIPRKLRNVDLQKLANSRNGAEELVSVLSKIPKYSTLNYGMTASQAVVRLVTETLPKIYGKNTEIQVLAPMIRGSIGTQNLNKTIQDKINPYNQESGQIIIGEKYFRIGDRVIQNVNNYDLDVFNGDIGKIIDINTEEYSLIVEFGNKEVIYSKENLTELALAYAITIHKSQGSEFSIIIIPLLTQHFNMLFRNLVYTGLTRAKRLAIFVGSRKAMAMAVNRIDMSQRQTTLSYLLNN